MGERQAIDLSDGVPGEAPIPAKAWEGASPGHIVESLVRRVDPVVLAHEQPKTLLHLAVLAGPPVLTEKMRGHMSPELLRVIEDLESRAVGLS